MEIPSDVGVCYRDYGPVDTHHDDRQGHHDEGQPRLSTEPGGRHDLCDRLRQRGVLPDRAMKAVPRDGGFCQSDSFCRLSTNLGRLAQSSADLGTWRARGRRSGKVSGGLTRAEQGQDSSRVGGSSLPALRRAGVHVDDNPGHR